MGRYKMDGKDSYQATELIAMKDDDPNSRKIELVGMDQIADLQQNSSIVTAELSYHNIVEVGVVNSSFQTVETLDLNHNLIHTWEEVVSILNSFSSLHNLILNSNCIQPSSTLLSLHSSVETLALSFTSLHLNDVIPFLPSLPQLHNLYMSNNSMKDLAIHDAIPSKSLQTLDLSSNGICQWSTLHSLSSLSCLSSFYVGDNAFASPPPISFPFIHFLDVSHIGIASFAQLQSILSQFPSLDDLEMRGNPWYSEEENAREVGVT